MLVRDRGRRKSEVRDRAGARTPCLRERRDQGRPVLALLRFIVCVVELSSAIPELVDSATRCSREAAGACLKTSGISY